MTPAAAIPPNEGAHRLAWWLAGAELVRRERLARRAATDAAALERMLRGELVPTDEAAAAIARATQGAVRPAHWERGATGAWGERPAARPARRT